MAQTEISQDQQLDDVTFDHIDDTITNTEEAEDISKYTTIDHLDEDPAIANQRFVLLSFISPEGIMNCKVRGLKVRGIYATVSEANAACDKLKKKDKYFDVFVGEVGKWLPWDPSMKQVEEVKYQNKKLDKIMSKLHETETKTLNELIGRRKDIIDKEAVSHKNRIRNSIKDTVDNFDEKQNTTTEEVPVQKVTKKSHTADAVKERLQRVLSERKKNAQKSAETVDSKKRELAEESARLLQKSEDVADLKKKTNEIDDKLRRMKEQFELKKQQTVTGSSENVKNC
jgi:hypothetical protein